MRDFRREAVYNSIDEAFEWQKEVLNRRISLSYSAFETDNISVKRKLFILFSKISWSNAWLGGFDWMLQDANY